MPTYDLRFATLQQKGNVFRGDSREEHTRSFEADSDDAAQTAAALVWATLKAEKDRLLVFISLSRTINWRPVLRKPRPVGQNRSSMKFTRILRDYTPNSTLLIENNEMI